MEIGYNTGRKDEVHRCFPGFPEETVRFFLDLRFHNETSWFHAHREAYEAYVRKPFSQFIQAMTPTVMRIADDMETRPNKCLARINRDIRFTRDKSPYRDHMWLLFRRSGEEREHSVMYWFELSPEVVEWGVGFWGYNRPAMDALRQRMVKKPAEVRRVLRQCGIPDETLHIYGDRYKSMKPPAGMPARFGHALSLQGDLCQASWRSAGGELPAGDHRPGFGGLSAPQASLSAASAGRG